ncbi:MAG: ABC transporter ATP-binding protein [Bacillota bacterium]|nr:ABC transporter ATP-binding protein [Bacillota bacterium]
MSQQQTKRPNSDQRGPGNQAATHGRVKFNKDTIPTFKRLFSYYKGKNLVRFIIAMCLIVVGALVSVKSSVFLGGIIDDYIEPLKGQLNPDFAGLVGAILKMVGIYAIGVIANLSYNLVMCTVSNGILKDIRFEMFAHMQTLPIKYYDINQYGDLMSRYTNDIDNIRMMLSQSVPQVFSTIITIVSVFIAMVKISLPLVGVVMCNVVLMYIITITIGGKSASYFKMRQKTLGKVNAYVEEMINGQKVVKVFCHEEENKKKFDIKNEDLCEKTAKANALSNVMMPMLVQLGNVQYAVLAMVGGLIAFNSGFTALTLGNLAAFLTLAQSFNRPVSMVSQQINSVVMALAGAKRVFDILDEKPETDEGEVTLVYAKENEDGSLLESSERTGIWAWKHPHSDGTITYERLRGAVTLDSVDFGYTEGQTVLHDVSLYAKPGQKIAFVGSTGAGKTTITNLINRFYDIEDGKIRYDGININKIKKADLRKSLGMVLQDTHLFTGTIMENIRYGRLDATDEEVIKAAKLANADSFITKLENGYNTVISGTGSQLSQGQCQLLAIARCAVADPPAMILDEATSSVDTRTEALIQEGMDRLMQGRTVFVIAHRLSTIQNSNAIMVLEAGRIIERGDHDDLLKQKGRYYQLYTGNSPS